VLVPVRSVSREQPIPFNEIKNAAINSRQYDFLFVDGGMALYPSFETGG